jgi:hypothetical protein
MRHSSGRRIRAGAGVIIPATLPVAALLAALILPTFSGQARGADDVKSFELAPGVVVDAALTQIYIMNPDRKIEAVGVANGETRWTSDAATKPVGVVGGQLIAQAETAGAPDQFKVVVLNPADGKPIATGTAGVKPGVLPSVKETVEGQFIARAVPAPTSGDGAIVSYQFIERPPQGIAPPPGLTAAAESAVVPGAPVPASVGVDVAAERLSDTFTLNLKTGSMSHLDAPPVPNQPAVAAASTDGRGAIAQATGRRFPSVDGRYVQTSERTGKLPEWDRYTLTIREKETDKIVGSFKSHDANTIPYFVSGKRVVFQTGPYRRRINDKIVSKPTEVHGIDLTTGQEWTRPILETAYRGPFPG